MAAASGAGARASPDELECGRASRWTKEPSTESSANPRLWPRCVFYSSPWQTTLEFALNMSNFACGQKPQVRISLFFGLLWCHFFKWCNGVSELLERKKKDKSRSCLFVQVAAGCYAVAICQNVRMEVVFVSFSWQTGNVRKYRYRPRCCFCCWWW